MSNFCGAFDNRAWSRKPSGGNQRRFEPSRHAKRPPLSSMNPVSRQGAHSHQAEREGCREEGRRDGAGQWGRQQFNRSSAKLSGPGVGGRMNLGDGCDSGTSQPTEPTPVSPLRTAIKDLYPHQPNTVSSIV
jgi:hypothetical protein